MATSLKEAFRQWEDEHKTTIGRATEVNLSFRIPPIQKLDNTLSQLPNCEFLSLSSNNIEKLVGLHNLKNLKILSLARNNIKELTGLEALSPTLEQLWISYNFIEKLKVIQSLTKLSVLYMAHNNVKEWVEVGRLQELAHLQDVLFLGNPLAETMDEAQYRKEMAKRLSQIKKLDGEAVLRDTLLESPPRDTID